MRVFIFLLFALFLFPMCFPYAGEAVVLVEKTWSIEANSTMPSIRLNGTFLMDNEFQDILQLNLSDGGAEFERNGEEIRVLFNAENFSGSKQIKATAIVRASYPLGIKENPPFSKNPLPSTGLVQYDDSISSAASSLSSGKATQLEAIASIADGTYEYLSYDLSQWGEPAPATQVFQGRKAVCVGYAHLFIAFARSLGFETRFVSGYAFSEDWQAHAWAEVKVGEQWVPVDPNFRELGAIDARHIISSYSNDQGGARDFLFATRPGCSLNSTVSVKTIEKKAFTQVLFAHTVLQGDDLKVVVYNPSNEYVSPTYYFSMPTHIHPGETRIFVIPPGTSAERIYRLSTSGLESGYSHSIPYTISMQGTTVTDELAITKGLEAAASPQNNYSPPKAESEPCPLITTSLMFALAALFSRRRLSRA